MAKSRKTLRSIIALLLVFLMVGSFLPTMASAADTSTAASVGDNLDQTLDESATLIERFVTSIRNFFLRIINFFKGLFGKDEVDPTPNDKVEVGDEAALKEVLEDGGRIYLTQDFICKGGESIVIPANVEATIYLQGNDIKNPVSGAPAIINYGELTIYGDGSIENGANDLKGSHTIRNYGTLVINGGNIGTFGTAGAAVVNDGLAIINGGNFASKQVNADKDSEYVFINNSGTMVINNATVDGKVNGLFAAKAGKIIVCGGFYRIQENSGYVANSGATAEIIFLGGTVHTNAPKDGKVLYANSNGDKFDQVAVDTDNITLIDTEIYKDGSRVNFTDEKPWTFNGGTLYLSDLTYIAKSGDALTIAGDTKLVIVGDVTLKGAVNGSGIKVNDGVRLEITGDGSLTTIGNEGKE